MARPAVLALVLLAFTAGCNGVGGSAPAGDNGTATVTPAPVPTPRTVGTTGEAPNAQALATQHATTLAQTNYTVVIRVQVVAGNRTVRSETRRRAVGRNAERYLLRRERTTRGFGSDAIAPVVSYWYDGSTVVARVGADGSTVRRYPDTATGPLRAPTDREYVERLAAAFKLRRDNGTDGVVFRSTWLAAPEFAPTPVADRPRNASVTLRVAERGHVESYRYAYDGTISGASERVRVVRAVRVEKVGRTTVTPPEWVERARATESETGSGIGTESSDRRAQQQ